MQPVMNQTPQIPRGMSGHIKRACDECRVRKVKCDAVWPRCSNCRMSELQCKYESPVKKRGPRFRVRHASQLYVHIKAQPQVHPHVDPQGQSQSQAASESWSASNSSSSEMFQSTPEIDSTAPNGRLKEAILIHHQLLSTIRTLCPETSLAQLTSNCIDSFMRFCFPLVPLIHEPSLRANQSFSVPLIPAVPNSTSGPFSYPPTMSNDGGKTDSQDYSLMKSFAILAGVCGSAITRSPTPSSTGDAELAVAFVTASRRMLALYYHEDIKNPDSSSIILRLLHSAHAHAAGETRLSWLILGETNRLAQEMNLHDEESLYGLDPVEAQLRRNVFWQLFTADKSAAILNNRPFTFTEFDMNSKISVSNQAWESTSLMDADSPKYSREFDLCIRIGFNVCQELWTSAANVLLELRLVHRRSSLLQAVPLSEAQISCLTGACVEFMSVLDNAPPWLQNPALGVPQESSTFPSNAVENQIRSFWVQHVNLHVAFHYLRLILLQKSTECHMSFLLGVSEQPIMIAFRKIEIAQEMLRVIQTAPFEALKVNGKLCVEKIRQVGASILEISQNIEVPQIAERAKVIFATLLDFISRLDSKL